MAHIGGGGGGWGIGGGLYFLLKLFRVAISSRALAIGADMLRGPKRHLTQG